MKYLFCVYAIFLSGCVNNISPSQVATPSVEKEISEIATNLDTPWSIAFLSTEEFIVTQREGIVTKINLRTGNSQSIAGITNTFETSEGGLMGMALHPQFTQNQYVYVYHTTRTTSGVKNQVERYRLTNNELTDKAVILENINAAEYHDGGALAFGPDGYLYITTGDAQTESLAQNTTSLNGKILRVKDDGTIPPDNPFANAIYAYGLRNPQGITWDDQGNLWTIDHGPSGNQSCCDEVNLIEKGKNYGWPVIRGNQTRDGMVAPTIQSGDTDTWAPAGLAFFHGSLYFTGLKGEALYQAPLNGNKIVTLKTYYKNRFGRLRALNVGPDNYFYVATSNRDGRGTPQPTDDQILRLIF